MELEPIDELFIKRKVHISTVGWIVAIISGLMIYFTVLSVVNYMIIIQDLDIKNSLNIFLETENSINSFWVVLLNIRILLGIIAIFFLFSSIGLIRYRHWARKVFVISSWVFISLSFLGLLFYAFAFSKFTSSFFPLHNSESTIGSDSFSLFDLISKVQILAYSIILIVCIRALFRICLTFNRKEYKRLFI